MFYKSLISAKDNGEKRLGVLIDPDKARLNTLDQVIDRAVEARIDYFFIGGSLILDDKLDDCLSYIKAGTNIPTILFPGSTLQVNRKADAILFLSLISGRNAELLIGKHVIVAPYLKKSGLEVVPTGYMIIDGGRPTTATYVSQTLPIPADKPEIAVCTAMAGEMLGLRTLYLDAGSGSDDPVPEGMIRAVRDAVDLPLIVGGGIRTAEQVYRSTRAGADLIVVGNALEDNPALVAEMSAAIRESKTLSDP